MRNLFVREQGTAFAQNLVAFLVKSLLGETGASMVPRLTATSLG